MDKANLAEAVNGHIDNKVITPKVLRQWGDKVGAVSVVGKASKNLFNVYKYGENKTHTGNVSKYNIINNNEIEISYINGWSRLVLKVTGLEPNTDYTISAYLDKSNYDTSVASGFYDGSEYKDSGFTKGSGNVYLTFTSSSTGTFDMWFYGNWSGTNYSGSIVYQNIQLEKGSATEYEKHYEPIISIKDSKGAYHEVPYMTGKVSKNLYDKRNAYVEGASNQNITLRLDVLPNTTYTFSVGFYSWAVIYEYNSSGLVKTTGNTETSKIVTITTTSTTSFVYLSFYSGINNVSLSSIDFTQIQFEKGSIATSYEEYYEPTISIRTSDGTFREVEINKDNYSLGEQVIGTWIDGKTVYRRVIDIGSIPSNASRTYDIGLNLTNCFPIKWTMLGRFSWGMVKQYTEGRDLIASFRNDGFFLESYADFSSAIGILIVEYTKN